ncbi:YafY family protein [Candidatus Accumulibacter vicinus]|uniref:Proteasome accessory factor C n=1 Tax=Candidatus Accumulibacter vicinus TaxID=2954382 RepID=A0A084Y3X4_9PROT|nr:YafY family protein [Candidatus Accumulibacter vicinus]KFB69418.1 MAG: Proteasome accessory factor C [Candidatus Accumulibacter vicinus]
MTQAERFGIIERLLLSRCGVGFADLQDRLGVSRATLFRDLRDLRDRMRVPLIRDRATGRYCIDRSVERYPLPGVWFSAGEIHALLSMQHLLVAFDTGGILAEHISPLRERLASMLETRQDSAEDIVRRIRIVSAAARHCASQHFPTIAAALMERRRLRIDYCARSNGTTSEREVSPQRLTHYRDNWYLDAWCHLREELRSFAVDAIKTVKPAEVPAIDIADTQLDAALAAGYGIFAGSDVRWATLNFTARRARWVAAENWHAQQQGQFLEDGSYQLRVPYSSDPELIMDILKYGPDCQVVEPAELREKVRELLGEAVGRYGRE